MRALTDAVAPDRSPAILSDREIQDAIKKKQIIIDPIPQPYQYTTSAVDLCLSDELFELKTLDELQRDEPAGMERDATVNLLTVDVKDLYRKYAKPLPREPDGSFKLAPHKFVLGITREYVELPQNLKSPLA